MAQPGSAFALGARGRRFESCRPDQRQLRSDQSPGQGHAAGGPHDLDEMPGAGQTDPDVKGGVKGNHRGGGKGDHSQPCQEEENGRFGAAWSEALRGRRPSV